MLPYFLLIFCITTHLLTPITTLPQGAPESVCGTLLPWHSGGSVQPQRSPSPFRITPFTSQVGQGQTMRLEIESNPPNLAFGGFMIHARSATPPYQVVGRFEPIDPGQVKLINCDGGQENTATHVNPNAKNNLGLEWTAPTNFQGTVVFNSTIAQDYSNFWVGVQSIPVQIIGGGQVPPATGISTTRQPLTTTTPVYQPKSTSPGGDLYEGCGEGKGCIGFPEDCIVTKNCRAVAVIQNYGDRYQFELKTEPRSQAVYIALGLSDDTKMGDDSVMECVVEGGAVNAYTSYTIVDGSVYASNRSGISQDLIKLIDSSYIDGSIYCKIERDIISTVRGKRYDLNKDKFHLLLATGESLKENSVGYHGTEKISTAQKQSLAKLTASGADDMYEDCGGANNCLGLPEGCIANKNCKAISVIHVNNGRYEFELKTAAKSNAVYVALALSDDRKMGDDSVMECVEENGVVNAYTSYTTISPFASNRTSVNQNIVRLLESSFRDGSIYCRIERDAISTVWDRNYDLNRDTFHLILATGEKLKENSVGYHGPDKISTPQKLSLSSPQLRVQETPSLSSSNLNENALYNGCGRSKGCFGFPEGCLPSKNCNALSVLNVVGGKYQFELKTAPKSNAVYVALGLSDDTKMGDDSVMECVPENGVVKAYTSYTTIKPYASNRTGVNQNIIRLLESSYQDGSIYCKIERDTVTNVWGKQFDLARDELHLLLATGEKLKENSVGYHGGEKLATALKQPLADMFKATGDPIYSGCGQSKGCFGFPDGCISSQSCRAISVIHVQGERYQFELKAWPSATRPAYVALGLSDDIKMGDDSVIECVPEGGVVKAYTSYTGVNPYEASRTGVPQNIIKLLESSHNDGVIYCKIERQAMSTIRGKLFDLIKNKYYLLLATGDGLKDNSVGYHGTEKLSSGQKQFLSDTAEFAGASVLLLRLHAAFMLTAWIGTASLGILFARYFKQTWVGSQMCGKDQWFVWHRLFMVLTWTLTIAGFIIIFIQLDGWSAEDNPHALLGTITTVICFLQPIGALFRPAPNSKNRPLFNWGHWLGGNVAHILSIATIFYAVKLAKAELPAWLDWILVAFVAFHVIMHIVFSIAGCASDKKGGKRVTAFPMTDLSPGRGSMGVDRKQDAPHSKLRKTLLGLYIVIIVLFVVALVMIAVLAPIENTFTSVKSQMMN